MTEGPAPLGHVPVFASESHRRHAPATEWGGRDFIPCAETPARADAIEAAMIAAGATIQQVSPVDPDVLAAVHTIDYIKYLESAVRLWAQAGHGPRVLAGTYPPRGVPIDRPRTILGQAGWYGFGLGAPILDGTWEAARGAVACALRATAEVLDGAELAFGLCRPPGHHAGPDYGGGYCYLNNAALAADRLAAAIGRRGGVAIVDLDYHHGNGTQHLFWEREDVTYFSVHADPDDDYPYFTGRAGERGGGAGLGLTINEPLALGSGDATWLAAIRRGLDTMPAPAAIVVSLGLDAFDNDERFKVSTAGFEAAGELVGHVAPLVVLLEGGYRIDEIGRNVTAFLGGASSGRAIVV